MRAFFLRATKCTIILSCLLIEYFNQYLLLKYFTHHSARMKKLLVAVFTLITCQTYAQTPEIKVPGTFAVGLIFSPDYTYRSLQADPGVEGIAKHRDNFEIPKFGFTTGASVLYGFSNRVVFESGLLFSDKGEKTKEMPYTTLEPDSMTPKSGNHNHHYYYLDIPTKVNYYLTTGRVKFFVSGGASTNIFLQEKRTSAYTYANGRIENRTVTGTTNFSRVNLAVIAGAGVELEVADHLQLRVEPVYRRSVISIIQAPIKGYLYSAGVNFGVYYQL